MPRPRRPRRARDDPPPPPPPVVRLDPALALLEQLTQIDTFLANAGVGITPRQQRQLGDVVAVLSRCEEEVLYRTAVMLLRHLPGLLREPEESPPTLPDGRCVTELKQGYLLGYQIAKFPKQKDLLP